MHCYKDRIELSNVCVIFGTKIGLQLICEKWEPFNVCLLLCSHEWKSV